MSHQLGLRPQANEVVTEGLGKMESHTVGCPFHPQVRLRVQVAELVPVGSHAEAGQSAGLECPHCGRVWPLVDGIPDFVASQVEPGSFLDAESRQWDEQAAEYERARSRDEIYMASLHAAVDVLSAQTGEVILDAGCGTCLSARHYYRPGMKVVGLDVSLGSLRYQQQVGHPPMQLVRGNLTELPFPEASFDKVLCANVLQQIADENDRLTCIRELARVAKPSARIVISTHNYSIPKMRKGYSKEGPAGSPSGKVQYVYRFAPDEFRCLLTSTLSVERVIGAGYPLPYRCKLSPLSRRLERVLWRFPWWISHAHMLVGVCRKG